MKTSSAVIKCRHGYKWAISYMGMCIKHGQARTQREAHERVAEAKDPLKHVDFLSLPALRPSQFNRSNRC